MQIYPSYKEEEEEEVRAPAKSSSSSSSAELALRQSLIQIPAKPQSQPEPQRKLITSSQFLEILSKQGTTTVVVPGSSDYQSAAAIHQCDITSPVDYGRRDYYHPSSIPNCDAPPHICKPNELDELYKTCTDTRGNWWEGTWS